MAEDAVGDEIEELVAQAKDEGDDEAEAEDKPKPKRVRKTRSRSRKKKDDDEDSSNGSTGPAKTLEQMDVDELLPQGLPAPEQNIKGLGDLYAKYGVGDRPEFKIHLYRTYPKIAPGGVKFDGFYDEYDIPITEQQVQADYGGGQYRIAVIGPHPNNPRLPKTYGSHSIGLAGEPNWERMPRALQGKKKPDTDTSGNPPPLPMMPSHENPKLAEAALKMFEKTAEAEREERRRLEAKMDAAAATRGAGSDAVAEAERRRADDLIRSERERGEAERSMMQQRMDEMKREQEESRRRMEHEMRSRPSVGEEIRALAQAGLFKSDDGGTSRAMLEQVLGKHRDEISAIHDAHREFVKSLREGHQAEIAALRSAHQREMEAERAASRSREERIEDRLRSEREERERDRVRHREAMEERDRHWKDRMEGQLQMQQSSWESRHQASVSTYENRLQWMQQEIDKLKSENYELRMKQEEKGDFFTQLSKHREVSSFLKDLSGGDSSSTASASAGGIGLTGGGDDWKQTLAEGLSERAPQIMEKLFGTGGAVQQTPQPTPQQMQQFHEGQVVDTPQGKMEVVRNPADGQLALAPKEALDRHRAAVAAQQQGGGLLPSGGGDPRSAPAAPQQQAAKPNGRPRRRSRGISAVPNLAEGLPKRRPPWEGGGDDGSAPDLPPPPPPPPPVPRAATRKPDTPPPSEPIELSAIERQGLQMIAKEVHESVQQADEPEEFVHKMLEKYPTTILQQIVGGYSDRQIVQGIQQLQPGSAGATPAGKQFVMQAFRMLRTAVAS